MRGEDVLQEALFTVSKLDDFVPANHPLRAIRLVVNEALGRLNGQHWHRGEPKSLDDAAGAANA